MTSDEIREYIKEAYEELKSIRRRARSGYPYSEDKENQNIINDWLDAAYDELEKRIQSFHKV